MSTEQPTPALVYTKWDFGDLRITMHLQLSPGCCDARGIWLLYTWDIPWPVASATVLTNAEGLELLSPSGAAWIDYLHVLPDYRRRGLGTKLVRVLKDHYGAVDGTPVNRPDARRFFDALRRLELVTSGAADAAMQRSMAECREQHERRKR